MTAYATLIPQGNPQLDAISIDSTLFMVGSSEAPFCDYAAEDLVGLDRDHARLFNESGTFHLVHMGGPGTTKVNKAPIGNAPVKVSDGDQLCFGKSLRFRIRMNDPALTRPSTLSVTLSPKADNPRSEQIVLTSFPVLICRNAEVLKHYRAEGSDALKQLSRRHAYLFAQNNTLYVEDLGSTNGTFVNGSRLSPHVRTALSHDDSLCFGHLRLAFNVGIEHLEAPTMNSHAPTDEHPESSTTGGTLFIRRRDDSLYASGADSFLSIFCERPEQESLEELEPGKQKPAKRSAWAKIQLFLAELKEALSDPGESSGGGRQKLVYAAVAFLLLSGVAFVYFDTAPTRGMAALMEQQDFEAGMRQGLNWLAKDPENEKLRAMVQVAMTKALVPHWLSNIQARKFVEATRLLVDARQDSQGDRDARKLIATLNWVTDLEEFYAWRGGADAPLVLFKHEKPMSLLLRRRESDEREQELVLAQVAAQVPEFEAYRTTIASRLRTLRNEENIYLKAIDRLKGDVTRQLAAGEWSQLLQQIDKFETQYPSVSGVGLLREDVEQFAALQHAHERGRLAAVLEAYDRQANTPIVEDAFREWRQRSLPDDVAMQQYAAALRGWQEGQGEAVLKLLAPLESQTWGAVATAKRVHFAKILARFAELTGDRVLNEYGLQLLEFHQSLDPVEDSYYLAAIAEEVRLQRDDALAQAQELAAAANEDWRIYKRAGGIDGLLRLEDAVSAHYRNRSEQLAAAYDKVSGSVRLYALLHESHPPETAQLYNDVLLETKRQRQWLSDLAMVLNTDLLNAKLGLLPDPEGTPQ